MVQREKEKLEEARRIIRAERQEQYLRALESEDVPVGIVILEGEKRLITFVNPVLSKLWGKTKEQVLHRPLFEAFPELEVQARLLMKYRERQHVILFVSSKGRASSFMGIEIALDKSL